MTPPDACALHRFTPWRPVDGGLLERRCPCGSVERVLPAVLFLELHGPVLADKDLEVDHE